MDNIKCITPVRKKNRVEKEKEYTNKNYVKKMYMVGTNRSLWASSLCAIHGGRRL